MAFQREFSTESVGPHDSPVGQPVVVPIPELAIRESSLEAQGGSRAQLPGHLALDAGLLLRVLDDGSNDNRDRFPVKDVVTFFIERDDLDLVSPDLLQKCAESTR